ncbi:MAG: AMP-binding protein [Clostridia bacterium]|nr:AMP-binding protein [Clostridia bacterium]
MYVYDGRAVCRQVIDLIECRAGRTLTREELGPQRALCLLPFSDSFALLDGIIAAPIMGFVPLYAEGRTAEALFAGGRRMKAELICASPAQLNAFLCPAAARQALLPAPRRRPLESAARFSLFLQRLLPEGGMSIARHTLNEWPARRLLGTACRQVTLCGGSPAPDALRYAVSLGYGIAYACGCTESGITLYDGSMDPDARLAPCSGRPLGDVSCRVSEEGELLITGPVLCTGTLADGLLTPLPMGGGKPFSTGKKAHFDARGRLHITGGIPRGTRV